MDLEASAGYGTNNLYEISAAHGMYAVGDFGYYITANRRETDGFRDNADLTHNDGSLKLVYDRGDLFNVSLFGTVLDRENGSPGVKPPPGTKPWSVNGFQLYNSESAQLLDRGEANGLQHGAGNQHQTL